MSKMLATRNETETVLLSVPWATYSPMISKTDNPMSKVTAHFLSVRKPYKPAIYTMLAAEHHQNPRAKYHGSVDILPIEIKKPG
jgi:hypothetical protein